MFFLLFSSMKNEKNIFFTLKTRKNLEVKSLVAEIH